MATASEQKCPEEEGLGTVGKFIDERFVRKSPAKPYYRPPNALRASGNNSWILKLVDPAQRLISSGSQMLFSSVIRNFPHHLTSRVSSQESSQSRKDDKEADVTDPFEVQVDVGDNRSRSSDQVLMMELEKTLKQKTFTRSEIDHFTTLLHSRNVDLPVVNEEKRFKFISSIPESNRKELVKIPNSEVRIGRPSISTPVLSSRVLDEDISSPAETARAYMGSRQPKVCPSMRSLRTQGVGENSAGPTSILFSSKSSDMSLVPSSNSQSLKRRSSIFDERIGPVVPLRRTRQKPNIHLSEGLSSPVSARPISVPEDGLSFDAYQSSKFGRTQNFPSSIWNSQLSLKPKKTFARKFIMNVVNHNIPRAGSSSIYTPSRSSKMASKILEQLDKLTSPTELISKFKRLPIGEKSHSKLSPLTVGGHLRNVKVVDLPRNEEFVHDDKQSNSLHGISYQDNQENTSQNKEKLEKLKPSDPHPSCVLLKDSGSIGSSKDSMNDLGMPASAVVKSTTQPPKDKRPFPMSSDKDNVDQDESSADRVAPATADVREGDISLAARQTTASEALATVKPQTTTEVIVDSSLNRSSDSKTSDDSNDDLDTRVTFPNASSLRTSQPETIDSFGDKDLPDNKQIDSPVLSFVNNVSPRKQPNGSSTAFDVGNKYASLAESCAASEYGNDPSYPYTQCDPDSLDRKLDCSGRTCNDAFSSSTSISGLAFSFSSTPSHQSLNTGLSISCPSLYSSYSPPTASMSQSSSRNIFLYASNNANITTTLASSFSPSTSGIGSYEDKIKQDASLRNVNDTYFSSITNPANSHYSMFSFGSAATPIVGSATELSAQEISAGKEFTANAERTSIILGSSLSHVSSGMAGKVSVSSELFNSGSRPLEFPITGFTNPPATFNVSTSMTCLGFESFTGASFSSICSTTSAAALAGSSSKPVSINSHPKVAFRVSSGNNDCKEQGISKDNVPLFSQKPIPRPSSGFSFGPGSASTSELNPFQVGKQQTLAELQHSYPYIASSSSLEAKAGSGDKTNRRFVKIKRKK